MPTTVPANRNTLGLMTKFWDVGNVKTRLGQRIGMSRAAALHRLFVLHLCQSLSTFEGQRVVCLSPESRLEAFLSQLHDQGLEQQWRVVPQVEGDLGNRIQHWFESSFHDSDFPAERVVLIGGDCPLLTGTLVEEAVSRLQSHDVVVGPAVDGGYYLIGIAAPWRAARFQALFQEIPWSTDQVLNRTRERLAQSGLSWYELEELEDVDTLADLHRLLVHLSRGLRETLDDVALRRQIDLLFAMKRILADSVGDMFADGLDPTSGCQP